MTLSLQPSIRGPLTWIALTALPLLPADLASAADPAVAPTAAAGTPPVAADAASFVEFVQEDDSECMIREGKHVAVRSTHPARTVRVWLDRYYRDRGTGDRSRSDLKPGAEPEPLGCSRVDDGKQDWRIVRAMFVD